MVGCEDCIHYEVCDYRDPARYETIQELKNDCRHCIPTTDVAPKSEVERLKATIERLEQEKEKMLVSATTDIPITMETLFKVRTEHPIFKAIKGEVAREIFERLHSHRKFDGHTVSVWLNDLVCIAKEYGIDLEGDAELKKKYTGEKT